MGDSGVSVPEVPYLNVIKALQLNLKNAGYLTDEQATDIINYFYEIIISEEVTAEIVIDAVEYTYNVIYTREDLTTEDKITITLIIINTIYENVDFTEEKFGEAYNEAYAICKQNGLIDAANLYIDLAIAELEALYETLYAQSVNADLENSKALALNEITATINTLYEIKALVNCENYDAAKAQLLGELVNSLASHLDNLCGFAAELNVLGAKYLPVAVAELKELVKNLKAFAYDYVATNASIAYEALVSAITEAVKGYGSEAVNKIAAWLYENREEVLLSIVNGGREFVEFINENEENIFAIIGFFASDCDERVFNYVMDNASLVLPALCAWVACQGDAAWDIIAVYAEAVYAIVDVDVETKEELLNIFDSIVEQLEKLENELSNKANKDYATAIEALAALEQAVIELKPYFAAEGRQFVNKLLDKIYETVKNIAEDRISGHFTPTEDSFIVSVNGSKAEYAKLLAEALAKNLDVNSLKLGNTTWDNLDYDMLALADLITIGYDENELSTFAVAQLLAYISEFAEGKLQPSVNAYIEDAITTLADYMYVIKQEKVDLTIADLQAYANNAIYEVLAENGYVNLSGREVADMDWSKFVGAENVQYVEKALAKIRAELIAAGIPETYVYEVKAIDVIFENDTIAEYFTKELVEEVLGDKAVYTIEIPVADAALFAIESYLYSYVQFQAQYVELLMDLYEINPDATVILLGHYNAFGMELTLGDATIDLSEIYGYVVKASDITPFAYALISENVIYVDISDAETVYESMVNAGAADGTVLDFAIKYLMNPTVTNISSAGQKYIFEQIMGVLTVGCEHKYTNSCDATCNKCGYVREVIGHIYDGDCDIECNVCGERREGAGHKFDSASCEAVCTVCGAKRGNGQHRIGDCTVGTCILCGLNFGTSEHKYDNCNDLKCSKCDVVREYVGHIYTDCNDTTCNNCDATRTALKHVYTNDCDATCNRCNEERTVAEHVYSSCVDTDCNVCGAERAAGTHTVDGCEGAVCTVCGYNVAAAGHKYGEWVAANGVETKTCSVCSKKLTRNIAVLPESGLPAGTVAGVVVVSVLVAGLGGFAIYWFLIQKKTLEQLIAIFPKKVEATAGEAPKADSKKEDK